MKPMLVSKTEASRLLHMRTEKLLKLIKNKEIKAFYEDNRWQVSVKSIEEYIERKCGNDG